MLDFLLLINLGDTSSNKALYYHKFGGLSKQMNLKFTLY